MQILLPNLHGSKVQLGNKLGLLVQILLHASCLVDNGDKSMCLASRKESYALVDVNSLGPRTQICVNA